MPTFLRIEVILTLDSDLKKNSSDSYYGKRGKPYRKEKNANSPFNATCCAVNGALNE